jgi:biopolymer transport protein ExbB/TolQ
LGWVFLLNWAVGGGVSLFGLIASFGAVAGESVDASQKARVLAEGISEAMNAFAISLLAMIIFTIVMLVLTYRYRWSRKDDDPRGNPPYR